MKVCSDLFLFEGDGRQTIFLMKKKEDPPSFLLSFFSASTLKRKVLPFFFFENKVNPFLFQTIMCGLIWQTTLFFFLIGSVFKIDERMGWHRLSFWCLGFVASFMHWPIIFYVVRQLGFPFLFVSKMPLF